MHGFTHHKIIQEKHPQGNPSVFVYGNMGIQLSENYTTMPVSISDTKDQYMTGLGPKNWNHHNTGNKRSGMNTFTRKH
jgi:hypothetical protein